MNPQLLSNPPPSAPFCWFLRKCPHGYLCLELQSTSGDTFRILSEGSGHLLLSNVGQWWSCVCFANVEGRVNRPTTKHLVVQWVIHFNRVILWFWWSKMNCNPPPGAFEVISIVWFWLQDEQFIMPLKNWSCPILGKTLTKQENVPCIHISL